ncbi:MAG: hypothetical protein QM775_07865 [Pirellulales bacterium]
MEKKKRRHFDLETQQRLCAMVSVGMSVRAAAGLCETPEATVRARQQRDTAFREKLTHAKQMREVMPLRHIREAGSKNWRAAAWLLERLRPTEYVARKPGTWQAPEISEMLQSVINQFVTILNREVPNRAANERVRHAARKVARAIDDISRSGPDLAPRPIPTVRSRRLSAAERAAIDKKYAEGNEDYADDDQFGDEKDERHGV